MKITFLAFVLVACALTSCQSRIVDGTNTPPSTPRTTSTPEPKPTKPLIPDELLKASPEQLCAKLKEIKTMPTTKEPTQTDPIYEALISKGNAAIPCLIENITNIQKVPDPRYSVPHWQHFAVGDTAVFVLVDIVGKDDKEQEKLLIEMMPPRSQKEWVANGIYAYFNYVSEPKNRSELQKWWKNWLSKNKK